MKKLWERVPAPKSVGTPFPPIATLQLNQNLADDTEYAAISSGLK